MTTTNTPAIATAGLSAQEAQERLRRYGTNAVPEERPHPLMLLLHEFWSPVPWTPEARRKLSRASTRPVPYSIRRTESPWTSSLGVVA